MRGLILKILFIALLFSLPKIGGTNAFYSASQTSTGNQLSTGCWANPAAVALTTPLSSSSVSTQNVTFAWAQTTSTCSLANLSYNFQIYIGSTLAQESGWTTDVTYTINNIPDGVYWWHVLTKDQFSGTSTSGVFQLTVDRTVPTATLTVANSPVKTVENRIVNGNFATNLGGWTTSGDVVQTASGARLGRETYTNDIGNYVWENRLMQSFQAGVKNLSLDYNFFTKDSGTFDDPGFFIRLNGQEIFATGAASIINSSGWQHFDYDLSGYPDTTILNLAIYAGNTGSTDYQSWAYVTNITTDTVTASSSATYNVTGTSNCFYKVGSTWLPATNFHLGPTDGPYNLNYKCISDSGVSSQEDVVPVKVDSVAPTTITDLETTIVTANSVILTWTAPNGASTYDLRYSTATISAENFSSATKYSGINAAKGNGESESVEVLGLNPATTYYLAIKSADASPNWSAISNVVTDTTKVAPLDFSEGDVVINELMWMGTGAGADDEYLELRNMTGRTISLSNFSLEKYDGTDMGIDFSGKSIAPNGYFLITNFATGSASSHLKSGVVSNLVDSSLTLNNSNLGLKLLANGIQIDTAGNGSTPLSGIYDGTSDVKKYYSMERTTVPGDGANALSWYTCVDPASTGDFFTGSFERGTPGAQNRSENEPVSHSPGIVLTKSATAVTFIVENADGFTGASYELTYDTDTVPQGVMGKGTSSIITLGTCSTGGTCVYHTGVKNIHLKVTLFDKDNKEILLEKDLP